MFLSLAQQLFLGRFTFLGHDHYWFLKWNQCKVARRASSHQELHQTLPLHKISCWYPKDIVLAKMTQTQRLWFREIWCYHISHIARTPIACIFISGVSLELTFHFRASQPGQSHRHYWEEEAFCKFWVDLRSPEVVVAEKSPVDDVQQDEAGRTKRKMHKLNCRQFSKIRCKDLRSNMNQLSWKDPWNNLPTLFLIDWALRQVLIAFWFLQRWRHTMTKDHNYLQKDR